VSTGHNRDSQRADFSGFPARLNELADVGLNLFFAPSYREFQTMTTIACCNGFMACDSQWTDGAGLSMTSKEKITRLPSGALLGEAGDNDSRDIRTLLANVTTPDELPTRAELCALRMDSYAGMILFPTKELWVHHYRRA
jgi:hypothetical protein